MKYDKDDKMKRLTEAIGQLLLEKGHQAIGVNQVALQAGVAKSAIYDYFGSFNELVKTYIRKKDYWMPFFDQLNLPDAEDRAALEKFFTVTLQEEFLFFFREPEMQRLILWQISTVSPLMRSTSETREQEGLKLLGLAEPYFRGSGISFRAVSGLIVGGIYYMVLHSVYNKSTVCGIDVNLESDRTVLLKTINSLVSLVWKQATLDTVAINEPPMNTETDVIAAIAQGLAAKNYQSRPGEPPDVAIEIEAGRLAKAIEVHCLAVQNEIQLSSYVNLMLRKLVAVADTLYRITDAPSAETDLLLELLGKVKRTVPHKVSGQLRLPLAFVAAQHQLLSQRWEKLLSSLTERGIDPLLLEITAIPLEAFTVADETLSWHDYVWLKRFFVVLEEPDREASGCPTADETLISRLIRLDFNQQRFLAYAYRLLKQKLQALPGKQDKIQELLRCKTQIIQDTAFTAIPFDRYAEPLVKQLCNWIDAEIALVKAVEPEERLNTKANPHKFNYKINAAGIAVWHKLQSEHGLLEEKVDELSVKIAYNCSSVGQTELSAPSQRSKFYTTDEKVIRPLADVMQGMLEDLRGMI